eukprot:COSAG02_NODE_48013_length_337_cov_0.584034_2_plen_49_part_01
MAHTSTSLSDPRHLKHVRYAALHACDDCVADVEVAQDAAQVINGADPQL